MELSSEQLAKCVNYHDGWKDGRDWVKGELLRDCGMINETLETYDVGIGDGKHAGREEMKAEVLKLLKDRAKPYPHNSRTRNVLEDLIRELEE